MYNEILQFLTKLSVRYYRPYDGPCKKEVNNFKRQLVSQSQITELGVLVVSRGQIAQVRSGVIVLMVVGSMFNKDCVHCPRFY